MRFRMRVPDESLLEEGTVDEIRERKEERVREACVDGGADRDWEEVAETVLVRRFGWWVRADDDRVFRRYRGETFGARSGASCGMRRTRDFQGF